MNTTSCISSKSLLRRRFRARRARLAADQRAAASHAICVRLQKQPQLSKPGDAIAVYLASPVEPDLTEYIAAMLEAGQTIVAPRGDGFARLTHCDDLPCDARGIPLPDGEPVEMGDISHFLVPGVAFSPLGARLGQGGGWYDLALAQRKANTCCIGIAFDEQLEADIPIEEHDIAMDFVATPTRWINCRSKAAADPTTPGATETHGC